MEATPERLTEFDRKRRTVGLVAGPLAFVAVLLVPTGLEAGAHRLAAVLALVVVFWISEAIPLAATALLGVALTVPLGIASAQAAFANFGHPVIFLFLGGFLIARGMAVHGLDRRIALFVLSRSWVGNRPGRILLAFGGIAWFLSMWMSNTATTAMMLPIALGVLRTLSCDAPVPHGAGHPAAAAHVRSGPEGRGGYAEGLLLMIAYSTSVGGIATPVGSPPNLIGLGLIERILHREIGFFEWMQFGLPISAALFVLLYGVIRLLFARRHAAIAGASETVFRERAALGPWSGGEKAALAAFLMAVVLWTLPGLVGIVAGADAPAAVALGRALPEGAAAILAASLLFLVPVNWRERRFALEWSEATRVDWGTILLFGGGLSLGTLAFDTGLAESFGKSVEGVAGGLSLALIVLFAVLVADGVTELMSNTATANLLVPIFLALAVRGDGSVLPALAATLGCSLAFCLPVATPPNALVYGTGRVRVSAMIRAGVVLDIGCAVIVWLGLLALAN